MNYSPLLLIFNGFLMLLVSFGCKKNQINNPSIVLTNQMNVAPCELDEKSSFSDTIYYGNSILIPEAAFSITLKDTTPGEYETIEFGFKTIPTTGNYYLVKDLSSSPQQPENQITYWKQYSGFSWKPAGTQDSIIYVENNENELIISYCGLPNPSNYNYDMTLNSWVGNDSGYVQYRFEY